MAPLKRWRWGEPGWKAVAVVAISTALPLMLGLFLGYMREAALLDGEVDFQARRLNRVISNDPTHWQLREHLLGTLLRPVSHLPEKSLVYAGDSLAAETTGTVAAPVLVRSAPLFDFGEVVGRVEIRRSLRPLALGSLWLGGVGFVVGAVAYLLLVLAPTRALDRANVALARQRQRAAVTLAAIADGVVVCDLSGRVEYLNPMAERLTAWTCEQAVGQPLAEVLDLADEAGERRSGGALGTAVASRDAVLIRRDGERLPIEYSVAPTHEADDDFIGTVIAFRDTCERRQHEANMRHQATHDALTGLPNRLLMADRLRQLITRVERHGYSLAVAFIDLDEFKYVNDTLGHDVGDQLLRVIADRLVASIRDGDSVTRLGGDEFVLLLSDVSSRGALQSILNRIMASVTEPLSLAQRTLTVSCSIGVTVFPDDGRDVETLLKNADTAMFQAKASGRNSACFYTPELHSQISRRMALVEQLQQALARDEFVLLYQPQVELGTGTVTGLEALLRWRHPEQGLVSPEHFIEVAEETGLIVPIGEWVLRAACAQARAWQMAGLRPLPMSVNVSAHQLTHPGLCDTVRRTLAETGLAPRLLELELTESLSMLGPNDGIALLRRMKAIGVRLAIDDFGTGYSNLGYLGRFPIDKLKIDRSFTQDLVTSRESFAVCKTVISLARGLNLVVVAEGVETLEQVAVLARLGCDQIQGYLFSRPVSAEDCADLLRQGKGLDLGRAGLAIRRRTLLIVDDVPVVTAALQRSLRGQDIRILAASSAREAFDLMATNEVGVVLADYRMPEVDGLDLLDAIRQMHPKTVRILMSGLDEFDVTTEAINRCAVFKFLRKPCDNEVLRAVLHEAFNLHEAGIDGCQDARAIMSPS